jgi:formate hydrogenlyase transcriptional activator
MASRPDCTLKLVGEVFAHAIARKREQEKLLGAIAEIKVLKDRLERENAYLKDVVHIRPQGLVGKSPRFLSVLDEIAQVVQTGSTVLLLGETGTGKEVLAQAIHDASGRKDRAMIKVNCAALPATLIESELFGREKGAFTGALARQAGRFEIALQPMGCHIQCSVIHGALVSTRPPTIRAASVWSATPTTRSRPRMSRSA